jgi:hypothetical protein
MISKTFASAWTMRRRSSGSPQASIEIFYAAVAAGDCALRRVSAQTPQRVEPVAILFAVLLRFRPCPPHLATRTACRSVRPAKSIAFPKLRATPLHSTERASKKADTLRCGHPQAGCMLAAAQALGIFGEPSQRPSGMEPPRCCAPALTRRAAWEDGEKGIPVGYSAAGAP